MIILELLFAHVDVVLLGRTEQNRTESGVRVGVGVGVGL